MLLLVRAPGYAVGEDGRMWWRCPDGRWLRDHDRPRAAAARLAQRELRAERERRATSDPTRYR